MVVQPDGKILVAGSFSDLGGQPQGNLARLNPDGTLDASFQPQVRGSVYALVVQQDGRIVVGGRFDNVNGKPRGNLARLNPDGSLEAAFDLRTKGAVFDGPKVAIWPDGVGAVFTLAVQPDGRIIVGGDFATLGSSPCCGIGRLNPDGTLDTAFAPGTDWPAIGTGLLEKGSGMTKFSPGMNGPVRALAVQADGKIVVAGSFTGISEQGAWLYPLIRLNPDGTLDTSFQQQTAEQIGGTVATLAVQPDGRIIIGGDLTVRQSWRDLNTPRRYLLRLNPDGTLDPTFNP